MLYRVRGTEIDSSDARCSELLAAAYAAKERPLCLCRRPGLDMYIAKVGSNRFVIKRMPNSGPLHEPSCDAYEPPPFLSGLGEVAGRAIQEDADTGTTTLKLGFSLSKQPGKAPPTPSEDGPDSVKADATKLTLRGTLHFLWDQAGFNRWHPGMEGKRNWRIVRHYLLDAAAGKSAKGASLQDLLFIPESFSAEGKDAIQRRRSAKLAGLASEGRSRPLMVLIGEVKEFAAARYGYKAVIRHLPDLPFFLSTDLYARMQKRFADELSLWHGLDGARLVIAATFGIGTSGFAAIEELALMVTDSRWLPFENTYEHALLVAAASQRRRFLKGLRYNMPGTRPLASMVLSDVQGGSVALYVVPADAGTAYRKELQELIRDTTLPAWVWNAAGSEPPALPSKNGYATPEGLLAQILPDERDTEASAADLLTIQTNDDGDPL